MSLTPDLENTSMRITSLVTLLFLSSLCPAQDAETAATSKLTEGALPPGAFRTLQKETVEQTSTLLKALYKDVKFGGIEVLLWSGDYSGEQPKILRQQMTKLLEKGGWACTEAESGQKFPEREAFIFSATRQNRRLLGLWIFSKDAALLIWGEEAPAAAGAEGAKGGEGTFENVIYTVPKNWKAEAAADGVTLVPTDLLPPEKLSVFILRGKDFAGSLAESAGRLWAGTCAEFQLDGGRLEGGVDVYQSFKGWKYFRHYQEVRKLPARFLLDVYYIQVGGRVETVAALTNYVNWPNDQSPLRSPKYDHPFVEFVFALKFKNHPEPVLPPAGLKGEGIVGVWAGTTLKISALTGNAELSGTTAAFYTNGQVFYSSHLHRLLFGAVSSYVAREVTPSHWGTYTFDQGSGTMKMMQGDIPIELKGEDLVVTSNKTPHKFIRLAPVDGMRWEGTWGFSDWEGKPRKITFGENGRFSDQGALNQLEHGLYALYAIAGKPGEGTYEVKSFSVLFHYADGREYSVPFLGIGVKKGDLRPAALTMGFNDDLMNRQ